MSSCSASPCLPCLSTTEINPRGAEDRQMPGKLGRFSLPWTFECLGVSPGSLGLFSLAWPPSLGYMLTLIGCISLHSSEDSESENSLAGLTEGGHGRSTATFNLLLVLLLGFPQTRPVLGLPTRRGLASARAASPHLWAAAPRLPRHASTSSKADTWPTAWLSGDMCLRMPRKSRSASCRTMACNDSSDSCRAYPVSSAGEPGRPSQPNSTGPPASSTSRSDSKPSGSGKPSPPSPSPLRGAPGSGPGSGPGPRGAVEPASRPLVCSPHSEPKSGPQTSSSSSEELMSRSGWPPDLGR